MRKSCRGALNILSACLSVFWQEDILFFGGENNAQRKGS